MVTSDARQRLLDAAIAHVAEHGLTERSLRQLAADLGTSHRMLSHHFGSKEGLWVAIVREVERRQLAGVGEVLPGPEVAYEDAMRAWWRHISDPSLWPHERLFFEIYAQGLRGRAPAAELLDGVVESWVEPVAAALVRAGRPVREARASARLSVAVVRGLLLDLLATGEREEVDAAMERWIAMSAPSFAGRPRRQRAKT